MTESEAIETLNIHRTFNNGHNAKVEAIDIAIKSIEEIQQYRAIGTVDECREARERQRAKKPEHFYKKYGKHKWKRKENGEIDEDAWDSDVHSGVVCEICGECICAMCDPDYDELEDCEEEYWICPNCGKKIYCKDEYCKCGQHLKWSDTD